MRPALSPRWLWLFHTLPLLVLAGLLRAQYGVFQSLLEPAGRVCWAEFGSALVALVVLTAAYAAWQQRRRRELPVAYGVVALAVHTAVLAGWFNNEHLLLPFSLPTWLAPPGLSLYPLTFLMPALAHALAVLVVRSVPEQAETPASVARTFAAALGAPLLVVIVGSVVLGTNRFGDYLFFPLFIIGTVAFLFFVARVAYLLTRRRVTGGGVPGLGTAWRVLVGAVMPLGGLALNVGMAQKAPLQWLHEGNEGLFGDFSGPVFFGLALLNGVLLSLPPFRARGLRLALLLGRAALLPFTLYFFVVLLPWLPLALVAVLAFGLGFLLLAPTLLLPLHLSLLADDMAALRRAFALGPGASRARRLTLPTALGAALLILPLALTMRTLHHRHTLHRALAQALTPDYAAAPAPLDATSLARTLRVVRQLKPSRFGFDFFYQPYQQPYLTSFFNWLVLDNLTLPEARLRLLEEIFLGLAPQPAVPVAPPTTAPAPSGPHLSELTARTHYEPRAGVWHSWVDLTISRAPELDPTSQAAISRREYQTTIALPPGAWVSQYYLDLNGHREYGLLAEAKAAAWIYAQIVGERRDPGLLRLLDGGAGLALNVFPCLPDTSRRTGFELLHRTPLTLTIDGRNLRLGDSTTAPPDRHPLTALGGQAVWVTASAKRALPLVRRQPQYHFLLDLTRAPARRAALAAQLQAWLWQHPEPARDAVFTLVDAYARRVPPHADWVATYRAASPAVGGYYAAGAVRQTLALAARHVTACWPVVVLVTDSARTDALADERTLALARLQPEPPVAYALAADGELQRLPFGNAGPIAAVGTADTTALTTPAVRAWPAAGPPHAYLSDDGQPSLVLPHPDVPLRLPDVLPKQAWTSGLALLAHYRSTEILHPDQAEAQRPVAVRAAIQTGLLTPLTALLALENDAQKAALRRLQAQILASNPNLEAGEESAPATAVPIDGGLGWLALAGLALALRTWRRQLGAGR